MKSLSAYLLSMPESVRSRAQQNFGLNVTSTRIRCCYRKRTGLSLPCSFPAIHSWTVFLGGGRILPRRILVHVVSPSLCRLEREPHVQKVDRGKSLGSPRTTSQRPSRAIKRSRLNQMKPGQTVKAKVESASTEHRVWCESCCIRIAPNEERTNVGSKAYHKHCYSKLSSKAKK